MKRAMLAKLAVAALAALQLAGCIVVPRGWHGDMGRHHGEYHHEEHHRGDFDQDGGGGY